MALIMGQGCELIIHGQDCDLLVTKVRCRDLPDSNGVTSDVGASLTCLVCTEYFKGLVQDCSICTALALEIPVLY